MKGKIVGSGAKTKYFIDGKEVTKRTFDRRFPDKPLGGSDSLVGWKPLASEALAVHPDQIPEAIEDARRKGVPVEFDAATGAPVFSCRTQRNAYLKAYGYFDRDAGYGDTQRGTYSGRTERDEDLRKQYEH